MTIGLFRRAVAIYSVGAIVFSFAGVATAQKNLDVCRVTTDTRTNGGGTGIYEIGKFPIDDISGITNKSFQYSWDKQLFTIEVSVEYGDMRDVEKGKPTRMMLSLLARRVEDKMNVLPVEAETQYRYKWGMIAVGIDVVNGDTIQHFQLRCSDGLSKNGLQRGEPKWLTNTKKKEAN